jgi:tRNA 2-thiocytidine biosynthesis protein TtcA
LSKKIRTEPSCSFHAQKPVLRDRTVRQLEQHILESTGQAVSDFGLIEEGDRIMVAVSGGKDSFTLLHVMDLLRRRAPGFFSLLAIHIDHGFPGESSAGIQEFVLARGFRFHLHRTDIAGLLEKKLNPRQNRCSLCSRLRRGALYGLAPELGCNKIALGHHSDDLVETLLLNLFFTGQIKTMPPLLRSDDGRNTVIRPLVYVAEEDIAVYAREKAFPVCGCGCPACGDLDNPQRRSLKEVLGKMEESHPGLKRSVLMATKNVAVSHLLDRLFLEQRRHPS